MDLLSLGTGGQYAIRNSRAPRDTHERVHQCRTTDQSSHRLSRGDSFRPPTTYEDVPLVLLQDGRVRVLADADGIAFDDNLRTQLLEVRALIRAHSSRWTLSNASSAASCRTFCTSPASGGPGNVGATFARPGPPPARPRGSLRVSGTTSVGRLCGIWSGRGVPRSQAMKIRGHRTEAVYRRYAIVSEADLREAI